MPHPIFDIDELSRLIIDELMGSQQTLLSLALTCQSLEEPALSSLWGRQNKLTVLLKVLPNHTWAQDEPSSRSTVSGRGPPGALFGLTSSGDRT